MNTQVTRLRNDLEAAFPHWEKAKDIIDASIDVMLNVSQSGHPGGSRSKVHALLAGILSGAMRFDFRNPMRPLADRLILVAGHCTPLVYSTLALVNESLRLRHAATGDDRYAHAEDENLVLTLRDLAGFRRRGGLPGHVEMAGKTMWLKSCTGPSGHGMPAAVGQALALKHGGADGVRVWAIEGEGGHTAGAHHESKNSSWGLGLGNLIVLMDWNDFGIDRQTVSSVVHGTPRTWYEGHGWHVTGTEDGSEWGPVTDALLGALDPAVDADTPRCVWFRTRKGRGYGKFDNASHGSPHGRNSNEFWGLMEGFAERHDASFEGFGEAAPDSTAEQDAQACAHLDTLREVLAADGDLVACVADAVTASADAVPDPAVACASVSLPDTLVSDRLDPGELPDSLFEKPGAKAPNRMGFSKFGAYVNALAREELGRPLVLAMSADLAESTNISGFAKDFEDSEGFGWYDRDGATGGALMPQEITEFTNSGMVCGVATVNFSDDPANEYSGYWGACSTYGSFSYLKYGPMRLFSQLAQDTRQKVGKVIWVAGHSGPETAEDSRTHFGIFAPGVTQLFPRGKVVQLHPWEANEVGPALAAALTGDWPIVALHLTRPSVTIPDREALGVPCHTAAARGAYVAREADPDRTPGGTVIVQGTSAAAAVFDLLSASAFDGDGPNVRIVVAVSRELFDVQDEAYRDSVLGEASWRDSTVITSQSRHLMGPWLYSQVSADYAHGADFDDRWRTGGRLEEVLDEAGLTSENLLQVMVRFADERDARLARLAGQPVSPVQSPA